MPTDTVKQIGVSVATSAVSVASDDHVVQIVTVIVSVINILFQLFKEWRKKQ